MKRAGEAILDRAERGMTFEIYGRLFVFHGRFFGRFSCQKARPVKAFDAKPEKPGSAHNPEGVGEPCANN